MSESQRAVLFDMDGVLLRSEEVWLRLLEEAGRRWRGHPVTREEFAPTFGQGTAADVAHFGLSCTPDELDRFYVERFGDHLAGVWVDPEAAPLLEALGRRGLALAVVTNTVSELAEVLLTRAGLRQAFREVVCADQVAHPKPAPDMVERALERLRVPAARAVYVGDSRFDRDAAAGADVRFVGLRIDGAARAERLGELEALLVP